MSHRLVLASLALAAATPLPALAADTADAARARNTIILDATGERNLRIETVEADLRTFETIAFALGRIVEAPARRSVVSSRVAGRVVQLLVFEGDTVAAGQRVALIESRLPGNPPPTVELVAPQGGIVVASHVVLGQPVEPAQELMDIADHSLLRAEARIPEQEAASVRVGTRARIRVPALGGEPIEAAVSRFGVEADPRSGTVTAIFDLPNGDARLRPGMRAEFSIVLATREGVLSIPREAVQGDPARRVVFVRDFELPHAFVRSPVILGETNERHVEVLSGLFPGDAVVTRGAYLLGFSGNDAGISLKEALDAAHGHEHAEDGSELTGDAGAHAGHDHGHDDHADEHDDHGHILLLAWAIISTLGLLVTLQMLWNRRLKQDAAPRAEDSRDA